MKTNFNDHFPPEILKATADLDLVITSSSCHQAIEEILAQSILVGGKRLRPLLCFLMGHLLHLPPRELSIFSRATELVHGASLSHDDVIDNATLRRGLPSINMIASNKKAVLAGDYLLSKVIVDLCTTNRLDLVSAMASVIKELTEGEWLQLDLISSKAYTKKALYEVAFKKTSSVMGFCTFAPMAYLNFAPENVLKASKEFGEHLGIAFQLIDDVIDFSDSETSLKDQMLDFENGIVNSVSFDMFLSHPDLWQRYQAGENLLDLFKLIPKESLARSLKNIEAEAHLFLEKSLDALAVIETFLASPEFIDHEEKLKSQEDFKGQLSLKENLDQRLDYLRSLVSLLALRKK